MLVGSTGDLLVDKLALVCSTALEVVVEPAGVVVEPPGMEVELLGMVVELAGIVVDDEGKVTLYGAQ